MSDQTPAQRVGLAPPGPTTTATTLTPRPTPAPTPAPGTGTGAQETSPTNGAGKQTDDDPTATPTPTRVVLSDGLPLHAEQTGPATAPITVLLLHGWTLDHRIWHRQVESLAETLGDSVRLVGYDARGHGRSGVSALGEATLARLGDDLAELIAQVAPTGPVILAGHSLGGMTIMEYAHRHPDNFADRIAGLVLVGTTAEGHTHTCYGLPTRITWLVRLAETTGAGVLARCGGLRTPGPVLQALRPALRWLLFGDDCAPDDLDLTSSAVANAALVSIGGLRSSIGRQHRLATLAALGDLPVAALVGDRDRLTPPRCTESIVEALPNTELTLCPGAGHMLMLERPDEVTAALLAITRQALPPIPTPRRGPPPGPPR